MDIMKLMLTDMELPMDIMLMPTLTPITNQLTTQPLLIMNMNIIITINPLMLFPLSRYPK